MKGLLQSLLTAEIKKTPLELFLYLGVYTHNAQYQSCSVLLTFHDETKSAFRITWCKMIPNTISTAMFQINVAKQAINQPFKVYKQRYFEIIF